jgi:hypothetical protein
MEDELDRVGGAAADLLARVDRAVGTAGAPPDHPVWPLLRRLGALPGEVVDAVAALRPGPLAGAGPALGPLIDGYADTGRMAARGAAWSGAAADRFAAAAEALATHLTGEGTADRPGLAGRAHATAAFAGEIVAWMGQTRHAVAVSVAAALGSAEALTLRTAAGPSPQTAVAAADIAALVLGTVANAYDRAEELCGRWAGELIEEDLRPAGDEGGPPDFRGLSVGS